MKIKWTLLFSCIIISCLLTACQFDAKGIREISKVDVNSTEITLDLTDNVTVNAEITPKTDYENGLSTYFGNVWSEEGYSYESWKENANFMGKSIPDIFSKIIEDKIGNFDLKALDTLDLADDYGPCIDLYDRDGNDFLMYAQEQEDGSIKWPKMYYPQREISNWSNIRIDMENETDLDEFKNLDLKNTGIEIEAAIDFVSYICGYDISNEYICLKLPELGEEFYVLYLFPLVDGFPVYYEENNIEYDESKSLSDEVQERQIVEEHIATIENLWIKPQYVYFNEGKIVGVEINPSIHTGDIYEKNKKVVDIQEILKQTKNYFDKTLVADPVEITSITLGYNGDISDGSNGDIEHVIAPFWYVRYYDKTKGENGCNRCILFNAYTGEFVLEERFLY